MDHELLAYLAGAMDSDGSFGIKRSTYAMRVRGDASQPIFSERASLKQVTPQVPRLLKETFGGRCAVERASTENGKPLWGWHVSALKAAQATDAMFPFLRIKREQASALLELRHTHDNDRYKQFAYWFEKENPDWRTMPMLTYRETARRLGYAGPEIVSQAVRNQSLVALPREVVGREMARIPEPLVDAMRIHAARSKDGRGRVRPIQLIEWRERLWLKCRELNRIGTGAHPIYARTGVYALK